MAISSILKEKTDKRNSGTDCLFNGFLEDYLSIEENLDPVLREGFEKVLEEHENTRIITDYRMPVSEEAISNLIIRYKDIFKLKGKPLHIPYILYGEEDGVERALVVIPYAPYSGIYAKGYYYCMSEPGSEFIEDKNAFVALSTDNSELIADIYDRLYIEKAGVIQRRLDKQSFRGYEDLYAKAVEAGDAMCSSAYAKLVELEDRTDAIYDYVVHWFLLKKILYVQYMMDKKVLKDVHEGDVRQQRNKAKENSMRVNILGFSDMWRVTKEQLQTQETE